MPSLKVVLLGDRDDQQAFVGQVQGDIGELIQGTPVRTDKGTNLVYKQGTAEQQLYFATPNTGSEIAGDLKNADVVLFLTPAESAHLQTLIKDARMISWVGTLKDQVPNGQIYIHFPGTGESAEEKAVKEKLPVYKTLCFNHNQSRAKFLEFINAVNAQKVQQEPLREAVTMGSSGPKNVGNSEQPNVVSRFLGATLRFVFGAVVGLIVYNPLSSVFAALSAVQREFVSDLETRQKVSRIIGRLFMLALSPVFGPLKGLIYDGMYRQTRRGWHAGIKSSFRPFYEIPREANFNDFRSRVFDEKIADQFSQVGTPISRRNIIAGIVIISLVVAAGLAVWLPVVNAALAISAHAAQFGLGSLSLPQLALAASGAALVAGTFLYGVGVGVVKLGKMIANALSAKPQQGHSRLETSNKEAGIVSKVFGAVVGAVYGALAGLVIYNPVTSLFWGMRLLWDTIKNEKNEPVSSVFRKSLAALTTFIWLPVVATLLVGLLNQGIRGWQNGFASILGVGDEKSAGRKVYNLAKPQMRDIIAGLVITGLVVAAGLAFVVTPVSIFLGIPALLTTYGLAGMTTWALALIAASATLAATSIVYGIVSNTYDIWANRKVSASSSAATSAADAEPIAMSSSARAVEMMGRSPTVGSSVSQNAGPGWFTKNISTPVSDWWYGKGKSKAAHSADREPLLQEEVVTAGGPSLRHSGSDSE